MFSSPWFLLLVGAVGASMTMTCVWLVSIQIANASYVDWLHWVAWAVIALSSPSGWVAIVVPVLLFVLLFKVTGIPETEAQSLRSRGEDYRRYQQEVSVFVPLPPRRRTAR